MAKITATPGFEQRIATSKNFEECVAENLKAWGFLVALNGTEHTHPGFVEELRLSTDPVSLAVRFEPDMVICAADEYNKPPVSCYVEIKASAKLTIEKVAYEQYIKRARLGQFTAIVFKGRNNEILWNFIEEIKFSPSDKIVNAFPPERRFPIIDNWIHPRKAPYWKQIAGDNPQASGTPYRYVNPESLLPWADFKRCFFERQSLS